MLFYEKAVLVSLAISAVLIGSLGFLHNKSGQTPHLFIVNVLDKNLFDDCHIDAGQSSKHAMSINVPFEKLEGYAQKNFDKETSHIVIYCANYKCTASAEGARQLKALGFKHVWAYEGGSAEWMHLGNAVKGACQQGYLKDFEKPSKEFSHDGVDVISAQELKSKIEEHSNTCC